VGILTYSPILTNNIVGLIKVVKLIPTLRQLLDCGSNISSLLPARDMSLSLLRAQTLLMASTGSKNSSHRWNNKAARFVDLLFNRLTSLINCADEWRIYPPLQYRPRIFHFVLAEFYCRLPEQWHLGDRVCLSGKSFSLSMCPYEW
jgi:hypothetical protein